MCRPIRVTLLAVVLTGLLTSCSSSSSGADSAAEGDSQDTATTMENYFALIADGNQDACDMETERYATSANEEFAEFSDDAQVPDCRGRIEQTAGLLAAFKVDLSTAEFDVRDSSTATEATVDVAYPSQESEVYTLLFEGGEWLVDSDDDGIGAEPGEEDTAGGMSEQDAGVLGDAWVDAWCTVQIGDTREQVIDKMGSEPTEEFTAADDAEPQVSWSQGPYSFTVFLDTDGMANSFFANYDSLGESDLDRMPCVKDGGYDMMERTDD